MEGSQERVKEFALAELAAGRLLSTADAIFIEWVVTRAILKFELRNSAFLSAFMAGRGETAEGVPNDSSSNAPPRTKAATAVTTTEIDDHNISAQPQPQRTPADTDSVENALSHQLEQQRRAELSETSGAPHDKKITSSVKRKALPKTNDYRDIQVIERDDKL
ncbi:MAG: hypothetical protein M1814_002293 [Vezdaea aestivalis]|nr:MAG: hypothetical protein M1814_002293 [Vezdaea aestivalis]